MKDLSLFFKLSLIAMLALCVSGKMTAFNLTGKKIALIIAHENFRDEEFQEPHDLFTKSGASVEIVSTSLEEARGMLGKTVKPTMLLSEVSVDDFDAIVFVGGSGATVYWNDETAHKIAKEASEKGKIVAAICISPVTLANAGVLQGKRATVWDDGSRSYISKLEAGGASYVEQDVVRDGNVITANGPHAARKFAEEIAKALTE